MKHAIRRLRFHAALLASLGALILSFIAVVPSTAETGPDYAIANGWFFTQAGGGDGQGYSVLDAGTDTSGNTIKFWSEFQRLGGTETLGYPIGQRFNFEGFNYQPFQRGILQWRPEMNAAVLANTFQELQKAGKDDWLLNMKGVPKPVVDDGSGGDFQKALAIRMAWLTNEDIKAKYLANPNPQLIADWGVGRAMELYGLPMSEPEQHGPFISQRFQRGALQLWTEDVPSMPAKGTVVGILGGDMMKEAGLLPASSTQPEGPGGVPIALPSPTPAPPPPAPATPTYPWALNQVGAYPNCGTTYFTVRALDTNGNGVNGLTIRSWNDQGNAHEEGTRNSNGGDGYSDRIISSGVQGGRWYVMLVDGQGQQSSNVATINFSSTCDPAQGGVNQIALELRQGGSQPSAPAPAPSTAPQTQPTPVPASTSYSWRVSQTGAFPNCGTTYVRALVLDANGNGMNGMTLKSWNDWGNEYTASTNNHNGQDGYWDRVFGAGPVAGKWYVMLVDGQGRQSSNVVSFTFTDNCDPNSGAVQQVELEVRPN